MQEEGRLGCDDGELGVLQGVDGDEVEGSNVKRSSWTLRLILKVGCGWAVMVWAKGCMGLGCLYLDWINIKGPVWLILITRTNFTIIR